MTSLFFETKNMSDQMQTVREKMSLGRIVFSKSILRKAGERTVSACRKHTVLRSDAKKADPKAALLRTLEEDCKESSLRLCAAL